MRRTPRTGATLGTCVMAMLAVVAVMTAFWVSINLHNGKINGWMALPTALDAVLLLRLAGTRRGISGQIMATLTILSAAGIAVWITVGTRIGRVMGMSPSDSLQRMDPMLAFEVTREAATTWDWLWLLLALGLCLWLLRDNRSRR